MSQTSYQSLKLLRDCEAIQIPSGMRTKLPKGTSLLITQSLGGSYTVSVSSGGLFTIAGQDADALGMETVSEKAAPEAATGPLDEKRIWEQLKTCFDPEIPVNIVDLGLVYDLAVLPLLQGGHQVRVKMTLTAPGCGMGPSIAADAKSKILKVPGVAEADVQIVWDPPWNQTMISADGRARLGMA